MAANAHSESLKGAFITATGSVIAALIGAGAAVFVASITGHLTTPGDTRALERDRQENIQLTRDKAGLQEQIAGLRQENEGLTKQIVSLREASASIESSPKAQPLSSAPAGSKTVKVDQFIAELDGCEKSAGAVTCVAKLTNTKTDLVARLFNAWTSIIDPNGNEQIAKTVAMGAGTSPYDSGPFSFAETTLPTNVPVKVRVSFGGVDENATRLSLLSLGFEPRGAGGLPFKEIIQFRNIPLH